MPAVLLTGMSGVGKSTVLAELAARGIHTVDTDYGDWIEVVEGERLWREDAIAALLEEPRDLVMAGTVANQGRLYERFAGVVLLTVPVDEACAASALARTTTGARVPRNGPRSRTTSP